MIKFRDLLKESKYNLESMQKWELPNSGIKIFRKPSNNELIADKLFPEFIKENTSGSYNHYLEKISKFIQKKCPNISNEDFNEIDNMLDNILNAKGYMPDKNAPSTWY